MLILTDWTGDRGADPVLVWNPRTVETAEGWAGGSAWTAPGFNALFVAGLGAGGPLAPC